MNPTTIAPVTRVGWPQPDDSVHYFEREKRRTTDKKVRVYRVFSTSDSCEVKLSRGTRT